jgi:hypothetical protein
MSVAVPLQRSLSNEGMNSLFFPYSKGVRTNWQYCYDMYAVVHHIDKIFDEHYIYKYWTEVHDKTISTDFIEALCRSSANEMLE